MGTIQEVKTPGQTAKTGRMRTAPQGVGSTTRGLTHRIDTTDWRATVNGTRTCSGIDCGKPAIARGFCNHHYYLWHKATPAEERGRPSVIERFESKFTKLGPDDCWEWRDGETRGEYGTFRVDATRIVRASIFALEIHTGAPAPAGMLACHHCDNPPCVNPRHLYWGTPKQNMADSIQRNRRRRGSEIPLAKVDEHAVIGMRVAFANGESAPQLARRYGVAASTVYAITAGKTWTHVGGPLTAIKKRK